MKTIIAFVLLLLTPLAYAANECSNTPYRKLGLSCADLGLDSNRPVCRRGDQYARLCDDTYSGQVRTCASSLRCNNSSDNYTDNQHYGAKGGKGHGKYYDDYSYNDYDNYYGDFPYQDPRYNSRRPRRHGVYFAGAYRSCSVLEFDRKGRPRDFCGRGTINRDCQGRCERY